MPDDKVKNDKHISDRYTNAIDYYWKASKNNKKWYKLTRAFTVVLGALVTLIASLTSSTLIDGNPSLKIIFVIATPILAACLSIIAGFSQSFQWGSAWQNMILTAQQLQKEYDRYLVTEPSQRDFIAEADLLNKFVINETEGFFERMLGTGKSKIEIQKEPVQQPNDIDSIDKK